MRSKIESLVRIVLGTVVSRCRRDVTQQAKLKAVTLYVKSVQGARLAFIGGILLSLCLCVLLSGIIMIHVAVLLYLPWTTQAKALALLICGFIYLLISGGVLFALTREKNWMRFSKAGELVDKVISDC